VLPDPDETPTANDMGITEPPGPEADQARDFWRLQPSNDYYRSFQPQTLLLINRVARLRANSVLELGANVGRNIHWIERTLPGVTVEGIEVNPDHIEEGRRRFNLGERLWLGDDRSLEGLPEDYVDVTFTVSVLDHIPDVRQCLLNMVRISRLRVILIELVLSEHGRINDPSGVDFTYSHALFDLAEEMGITVASRVKCPLGEGILEHYETLELLPT
jgi:SAM-dependent methyltransferase